MRLYSSVKEKYVVHEMARFLIPPHIYRQKFSFVHSLGQIMLT